MTQKKYQVFISSTYTDLIEERKKVQEILLMADCIPAGMEAFVATTEEQFQIIKKVISSSAKRVKGSSLFLKRRQ